MYSIVYATTYQKCVKYPTEACRAQYLWYVCVFRALLLMIMYWNIVGSWGGATDATKLPSHRCHGGSEAACVSSDLSDLCASIVCNHVQSEIRSSRVQLLKILH